MYVKVVTDSKKIQFFLAITIHIRFYLDRVFDPNWPHVGLDRALILAEPVLSLSWRRTSILLLPETMEQPQTSSFFIFFFFK